MDLGFVELEKIWEEQQEEWERERQEKIRELQAQIDELNAIREEAEHCLNDSYAYHNSYVKKLERLNEQYSQNIYGIKGAIANEYLRVYKILGEDISELNSNFSAMIGNAESALETLITKINDLILERDSL
ncbi:MAG: hypothetical protein PUF12_01570 [Thermoflexaceae bacterium]|nr:hypothetical protein [Thermoflexaceae bacterium]